MGRVGWAVASQKGSHRKLVHVGRPGFLIVAFHGNIGRASVRRALQQAGIDEAAFLAAL